MVLALLESGRFLVSLNVVCVAKLMWSRVIAKFGMLTINLERDFIVSGRYDDISREVISIGVDI